MVRKARNCSSVSPATEVLEAEFSKVAKYYVDKAKPMIAFQRQKRSRTHIGSFETFEMTAFLEPLTQAENSIDFPPIEWPNSEDEGESAPIPKRRCTGLPRSKSCADLKSLDNPPRLEPPRSKSLEVLHQWTTYTK